MSKYTEDDNRSMQLNPNNDRYYDSRGTEAAIALTDFVEKYELVISAEDILDRYKDVEDRVEAQTASSLAHVIEKLSDHCKDNQWTNKQAKNLAAFADTLTGEQLVQMWIALFHFKNGWDPRRSRHHTPNALKVHKLLGQRLFKAVLESRNQRGDFDIFRKDNKK